MRLVVRIALLVEAGGVSIALLRLVVRIVLLVEAGGEDSTVG